MDEDSYHICQQFYHYLQHHRIPCKCCHRRCIPRIHRCHSYHLLREARSSCICFYMPCQSIRPGSLWSPSSSRTCLCSGILCRHLIRTYRSYPGNLWYCQIVYQYRHQYIDDMCHALQLVEIGKGEVRLQFWKLPKYWQYYAWAWVYRITLLLSWYIRRIFENNTLKVAISWILWRHTGYFQGSYSSSASNCWKWQLWHDISQEKIRNQILEFLMWS